MSGIVGIDPGLAGGIAYLYEDQAEAEPMPLLGGEIDGRALAEWLREREIALVVVEKVGAMPKQGVSSTFKFGMGYGRLLGVLETLSIPYRLVTPQAWKKRVLTGTARDKAAAIRYVSARYPSVDLRPGRKRVPHDGMADALCLAAYAMEATR